METVIREYLGQIKVGRTQRYRNVALFPLLSEYEAALDFVTLDEALAGGLIEVTEVSQGGSVPELKVVNKSARRVLILDGEELVGAKQNRIVNTTLIVEGYSTTVIPVSCVEQGRWSSKGAAFHSEERIMSAELRAMKAGQVRDSVRQSGRFRSDQGELWAQIGEKASRMKAASPTGAMSVLYKTQMPTLREYASRFRPVDAQVGAVLMINGRIAGLDTFAGPGTFAKYFRKLLESYVLDAIDRLEPAGEHKVRTGEVTAFLKESLSAAVESRASVGLGHDCRLSTENLTGFGLVVDGRVLHLSMFAGNGRDGEGTGYGSRMQRFSQRRRHRR